MRKRILAVLTTIVATLALSTAISATCHEGYSKWTSTDSLPSTPGNYVLTEDVTVNEWRFDKSALTSEELKAPANRFYICLNGHDITLTQNPITIAAFVDFFDCGTNTTYGYWNDQSTYILTETKPVVDTYDTLIGGIIRNTASKCAISVNGGFQCTMYGGNLAGNIANDGAAACVASDGIFILAGNATAIGNISTRYGGAFALEKSYSTTPDGTILYLKDNARIHNNRAKTRGGGVYLQGSGYTSSPGSSLIVTGNAQITNNISLSTNFSYEGGAVFGEDNCHVSLGGNSIISGNKAINGAAIRIGKTDKKYLKVGLLIKDNTTIKDNICTSNSATAAAVVASSGCVTELSGAPQIIGNTKTNEQPANMYLRDTATVKNLSPNAQVGIYVPLTNTSTNIVNTAVNNDGTNILNCFKIDNGNNMILSQDGKGNIIITTAQNPGEKPGENSGEKPGDDTNTETEPKKPIITAVFPSWHVLSFRTGRGEKMPQVMYPADKVVSLDGYVPIRNGYTFTGWYLDQALTKPVTEVTLTRNTAVYAGWVKTTDIVVEEAETNE